MRHMCGMTFQRPSLKGRRIIVRERERKRKSHTCSIRLVYNPLTSAINSSLSPAPKAPLFDKQMMTTTNRFSKPSSHFARICYIVRPSPSPLRLTPTPRTTAATPRWTTPRGTVEMKGLGLRAALGEVGLDLVAVVIVVVISGGVDGVGGVGVGGAWWW